VELEFAFWLGWVDVIFSMEFRSKLTLASGRAHCTLPKDIVPAEVEFAYGLDWVDVVFSMESKSELTLANTDAHYALHWLRLCRVNDVKNWMLATARLSSNSNLKGRRLSKKLFVASIR
jgi:hypothetical protein